VTILLAGAAVAAGAGLASATGFGFSLLCAPVLFVLLGPPQAVAVLLVLGAEVNALILAAERRRPRPLAQTTTAVLLAAVPGAFAGVAVLRSLDAVELQIALSVTILATLVLRRRTVRGRSAKAAPIAGFAAGALATSTSAAGPPLILHLLGREHDPEQVRDTLTLCFLGLSPIGAAALWATGTRDAVPDPLLVAALVPAVVVGQLAGRRVFDRLVAGGRYEPALTGVLAVSVVIGVVGAVAGA
jgi:uncharacterized membrane protein YfcA